MDTITIFPDDRMIVMIMIMAVGEDLQLNVVRVWYSSHT